MNARLLSLSRAARLVGVTRVALQKKIAVGALDAFEGMVSEESLLRAYPNVTMEDDSEIERLGQAKAIAYYARAAERLPSKEVLAMRLGALARDLSDARGEARRYRTVIGGLEERLKEWDKGGDEMQAASATLRAWLHEALENRNDPAGFRNLTIRDSFLRIMASHAKLLPSGREFFVDGTDTVLEAALRAGIAIDYGCSNGNCGRCKARVVSGQIMNVRSHEYALSDEDAAAGYALMCSCTAVSDVVIEAREARAASDIPPQRVAARVKELTALGDGVTLLLLRTPPNTRLRFLAGQSAVLHVGESLLGEFPIAGCPCDDGNLPFHVPRREGNHFSEYVRNKLKVGDAVGVEGPAGEFALRADAARRLVFIAFGMGFARLKGVIEHAMALDTASSMRLYWIADGETGPYFANWPRAMADALDNFHYVPLVAKAHLETAGGDRQRLLDGLLRQVVADEPELADADFYVAGPESLVDAAKSWLLAQGVPETRLTAGTVD